MSLRSDFAQLETRIAYSGSPLGDGGDLDIEALEGTAVEDHREIDDIDYARFDDADLSWAAEIPHDDFPPDKEIRELIVVDKGTEGYELLLEDVLRSKSQDFVRVILIEPDEDGITQISDALEGVSGLAAIHIVSHGDDGTVQLGDQSLNRDSLLANAGKIALWGSALSPSGDIMIYGCDVAETEAGEEFLESLAALTNADIAASRDVTGHASLGGDWQLEYAFGQVESHIVFSQDIQSSWIGSLDNIFVTTNQDEVNGDTSSISNLQSSPGGLGVSLREAVVAANANSSNDTIYLPGGNYTLTLNGSDESIGGGDAAIGDLDITEDLRIRATEGSTVSISAGTTGERVFHLHSGELRLRGLEISDGEPLGGAILADESTELWVRHSDITNNNNVGSASAGAVVVLGEAQISYTNLTANGQSSLNAGGALWIGPNGEVDLFRSSVVSNAANEGGGIYNAGELIVTESRIHGNQSIGGRGGGIYSETGATLTIDSSTISLNAANDGGGLYNASDGINPSNADLTNVTIAGNSAGATGGAIYNEGDVSLLYTTIAGNNAGGGPTSALGVENAATGVIDLTNTILDHGVSALSYAGTGTVNSGGGNLIADSVNFIPVPHITDQNGASAQLAGLTDNGGETPTRALIATSPAIDAGINVSPDTDQRGVARDATPDSGAYEVEAAATSVTAVPIDDDYVNVADGTVSGNVLSNDYLLAPNVVTDSLELEYVAHLDDDDGQWQNENGVSGFDFTMPGDANYVDEITSGPNGLGAAYQFSGSPALMPTLEGYVANATTSDVSFELWFRSDVNPTGKTVLFDSGEDQGGVSLILNAADSPGQAFLEFNVGSDVGAAVVNTFKSADITSQVAAGDLIHVVGTFSPSPTNSATELYVDGVQIIPPPPVTGSIITDWTSNASGDQTAIGGIDGTVATVHAAAELTNFTGEIASLRIYSKLLDATEVSQNHQAALDLNLVSPTPQVVTSADGISVSIAADGSFTYDPGSTYDFLPEGQTVADSFDYQVQTSSGNAETASVQIENTGVNEAPTVTTNTLFTPVAGSTTPITTNELAASDPDHAEDQIVYVITQLPTQGSLLFDSAPISLGGSFTQADLGDAATSRVSYYQNSGATLADVFQFQLTDPLSTATTDITFSVAATAVAQISGTVYEDVIGDGDIAGDSGTQAHVYLYADDDGTSGISSGDSLVGDTPTDPTGNYSFAVGTGGDYFVVVDSKSITPSAGFNTSPDPITGITPSQSDVWAVQTYGTEGAFAADGTNGTTQRTVPGFAGPVFGGRRGTASDNIANLVDSEHVTAVTVAPTPADVSGVDFGFSFNVVTNTFGGEDIDHDPTANRSMQGTLRQFIQNANAINGPNEMRFVPVVPTNDVNASGTDQWWTSTVRDPLPVLTDDDTTISGVAYAFENGNGGAILGGRTVRVENSETVGDTTTVVGLGTQTLAGVAGPEYQLIAESGFEVQHGLHLYGDNTRVDSISILGFGQSSGDHGANIRVGTSTVGPSGIQITNNVIGAGAAATAVELAGTTASSFGHGIEIERTTDGLIQNNVIALSGETGIKTRQTSNTRIESNEIRGNALNAGNQDGVDLASSTGNTVTSNLIVNNRGGGIDMFDSTGSNDLFQNTITGNGISGVETAGIRLFGTGNSVFQNLIQDNVGDGVLVTGDQGRPGTPAIQNLISQNSFANNGGTAIDLGAAGSAIRTGDGIDGLDGTQNSSGNIGLDRPVLASPIMDGTGLQISIGNVSASHILQLYVAAVPNAGDVSDRDPADPINGEYFGEGEHFISNLTFVGGSWTNGGSIAYAFGPHDSVTAIAIDPATGNTSEFSNVAAIEDRPEANDDSADVDENGTLTINVGTNDVDEDSNLIYTLVGAPPANTTTFDLQPDGTLTVVPDLSFSGVLTATYQVQEDRLNGLTDTATITITVNDTNDDEVFVRNEGLEVDESEVIGILQADLEWADPDGSPASIIYTLDVAPTEGSLLLGSTTLAIGQTFTQADIDAGNVTYDHRDSSDATSDQFEFTVGDGQGLETTGQFFDITIRNREQSVDVNDPLIVPKSIELPITNGLLLTTDPDAGDTPAELIYTLTSLPTAGTLELNGIALPVGGTFTQDDIDNNRITYDHIDSNDDLTDSFVFEVDDQQVDINGLLSPTTNQIFDITIVNQRPSFDPNSSLSITVNESETGLIADSDLRWTDADPIAADPPDEIIYTLTGLPTEGSLLVNGTALTTIGDTFTQADVANGLVSYDHDDNNDEASDSFEFTVSNPGDPSPQIHQFGITIQNREEQLQPLGTLQILETQHVTITNAEILTTDPDPGDLPAEITYTVTAAPSHGSLLLGSAPLGTAGATFTTLVAGNTFTQQDINDGLITYDHRDDNDDATDSFVFDVDDGQGTATTSRTFDIEIDNQDEVLDLSRLSLAVFEADLAFITPAELLTTDPDPGDLPSELVYRFSTTPAFGELRLGGTVLGVGDEFSQADVDAANRLAYFHDASNEESNDSFLFTVDDGEHPFGSPGRMADQTFTITIVNVEEVITTNDPITVLEGSSVVITENELQTTDIDDAPTQLTYTLASNVQNGQILLFDATSGLTIALDSTSVNRTFTQDDINNGRLSYVHDGSETSSDSFDFIVNDGQDSAQSATAVIDVQPANDPPTITLPNPQEVPENGTLTLSTDDPNNINIIVIGDPDASNFDVQLTLNAADGTLSLDPTAISALSSVTGNGTSTVVAQGTITELNAALDGLGFTPTPEFFGDTSIIVSVDDLGNVGSPGRRLVSRHVSVHVDELPNAVDDPTNTDDANYRVIGGGTNTLVVSAVNGVLSNDVRPPETGGAILRDAPTKGTVELALDGSFVYTPFDDIVDETDTFTYSLTNGTATDYATVTITVLPIPQDAPDNGDQPTTAPGAQPEDDSDPFETNEDVSSSRAVELEEATSDASSSRSSGAGADAVGFFNNEITTFVSTQSDTRRDSSRYMAALGIAEVDFETGTFDVATQLSLNTFSSSTLFQTLDTLEEAMLGATPEFGSFSVGSLALSSGLSIGWIVWSLKGGYIVGSLLSTASPWTLIDPLPVLDTLEKNDKKSTDQASDKLDQMIDD